MGILSNLFGGNNQTETTGVTTNEPWLPIQPNITGIVGSAKNLYGQQAGAAINPQIQKGILGNLNTAGIAAKTGGVTTHNQYGDLYGDAGQPGAAQQYLTSTAQGKYLNSDPYLDAVINDSSNAIQTRLQDIYSGAGRYGGATMNRDLADRLYANEAGTRSAAYQQERDRMMGAAGTLEAAQQGRLGLRQGILGDLTGVQQAQLGNKYAANDRLMGMGEYQQDRPWDLLSKYAGLAYPAAGLGGTATTEQPKTPFWQKLLGGLSAGAGILGSFI